RYRIFAGLSAPAAFMAGFAAPARAQDPITAAAAVPIVSEAVSTIVSQPKPKPKGEWLKAEVIHADSNSIIVREQANGMMIHTFTFAAPLKDKMSAVVDKGGYQ